MGVGGQSHSRGSPGVKRGLIKPRPTNTVNLKLETARHDKNRRMMNYLKVFKCLISNNTLDLPKSCEM